MVDYGRQNLGLNLQQGVIETIEIKEKFDLIIIIQVVAHLYDLSRSMHRMVSFLNPDGLILIETWDKDSWTSRIFGKYWHEYSPPSTLNYFSKKTLNLYMSRHRNLLIDQGTPKKNIHSKHAKSLISHKLMELKGLNIASDRKIFIFKKVMKVLDKHFRLVPMDEHVTSIINR